VQDELSAKPDVSVVVVTYNIPREIQRTLLSLSSAYQRHIGVDDYEVIVVDNGSNPPFDERIFEDLAGNFRLVRIDPAPPSPAHAINQGIAAAKGDIIGVMIDGARITTPGLLHFARQGARLYPTSIVATLGWYLGYDFQRWSMRYGYDKTREDALLASIAWPDDGYRLFDIATLDESSVEGWFFPLAESNALFMRRELWAQLGGVDERFHLPGGGLLNLDTFSRALALPAAQVVIPLGEGTFHQFHGGVATNKPVEDMGSSFDQWNDQYKEIRGHHFEWTLAKPPTFVGTLPRGVLVHFAHAAISPVRADQEAPLGGAFDPDLWSLGSVTRPVNATTAALVELAQKEFRAGRYAGAVAVARLVRERAPDEPEPQRLSSLIAAAIVLHARPQDADHHLALAEAHRLLHEHDAAASHYQAAISIDPSAFSKLLSLKSAEAQRDEHQELSERLRLQIGESLRLKTKLSLRFASDHLGSIARRARQSFRMEGRNSAPTGRSILAAVLRKLGRSDSKRQQTLIAGSGLFDSDWYLARNPDVAASGTNPLVHYLRHGAVEGRDPHPLFDSDWYLAQYSDVACGDSNPLVHYVEHGAVERRNPHPLFDSGWYLAQNPDVAASGENPLAHYLRQGAAEGRDPHPLFDSDWYLAQNPELAAAGINPLVHYIYRGVDKGRDPNPLFDSDWYLLHSPDVAATDENPLAHYIRAGAIERRNPVFVFHTAWYSAQAKVPPSINPLTHFLSDGLALSLPPNAVVSAARMEAVSRRVKADPNYRPTVGHLAPASDFPLPEKLEQFLRASYDGTLVAAIRSQYHFLDFYDRFRIDDTSLGANAEVEQLIDEVTGLIARKRRIQNRESVDATIIIPVHDKLVYTLCCLKAILAAPTRCSYEIVVADDASTDATSSVLGDLDGIVRLLRNSENQGFVRTCNAAAVRARGDIIVFLNNDTIPLPCWLDEIVDMLRRDPTIGLAGPKYLNIDGTLQEAGGIIWSDGSAENFGRGADPGAGPYSYVKDVDYISGAAVAVRAAIWRELGGFDEIYAPAYYEDVDLAFRVRAAGLRTVYQPFSRVIHFEGISHGRDLSGGIKAYQTRNRSTFYQRWRDTLAIENAVPGSGPDGRGGSRNQGRPRILIVDHYVPKPDRDSGSRAMLDYVKLFATAGFQVDFWPLNLQFDGSYTPPLQRLGVEVLYSSGSDIPNFESWLAINGPLLDYVILSRPTVAEGFIDIIDSRCDAKIMFFGVDIHFQRLAREFRTTGNPLAQQAMIDSEKLERKIWSKSDVICYYSNEERDFVLSECPGKTARAVPIFLLNTGRLGEMRRRVLKSGIPATKQAIFVAGFSHTPNVDAVLWLTARIWPSVVAAVPDARLCIVGSSPPAEVLALAGPTTIVTGPVSDSVLHLLYQSSSVSLVPLRYGAGVKGKVLEAISLGVPVVTTKIGIEGIPGAANFIDVCEGEEELAAAVIEILRNPGSRVKKILAGLEYLETHVSEAAARRTLSPDVPELAASEAPRAWSAIVGAA
jgi:GT2 family glycosyltransferase/tetratricopeptide (TPR) repeat protein